MIRLLVSILLLCPTLAAADQEQFFETQVRPLLAQHCFECHGEKKQQGGIRLDRRHDIFVGAELGPLVLANKPGESRLWQVVQYDESDTQMPPKGKLTDAALNTLKTWIEQGAYWPEEKGHQQPTTTGLARREDGNWDYAAIRQAHWSYQPITRPNIPEISGYGDQPIDRLIGQRMQMKDASLTLSPPAAKATFIRRLAFDLLGLPPSYEEVNEYVADDRPEAASELIERYLASPLYGQRWARMWLDVARYADTKGYVFTENRFYPYSYTYRDYVIDAFNNDVPYDQFILEQLAADQLGYAETDPRLAALGFLTVGPRFLNRTPDIIDDRIDVVTRGVLGMTMGCARCHDHKYDPVPTGDYYALYGVFDSCSEPDLPPLIGEIDSNDPKYQEYEAELDKRTQALEDYIRKTHHELLDEARARATDPLLSLAIDEGLIPKETKFNHGTPRDRMKAHWKRYIGEQLRKKNPLVTAFDQLMKIKPEELSERFTQLKQDNAPELAALLESVSQQQGDQELAKVHLVTGMGTLLESVFKEWNEVIKAHPEQMALESPGREAARQLLFGSGSVADVPANDNSPFFERDHRNKIRELEVKIADLRTTSPHAPPRAMVLLDKPNPVEPVVFIRGDVGRRGDRVARRVPHILDETDDGKFSQGSGRLELAKAIVAPENPLTARVIVNRIWAMHFGTPIVPTPSDFGLRGEPPTHPDLLNYLAWSFVHQHHWSIKGLHREILNSLVYQQSSLDRPECRKIDPTNERLWRQNRRRLDFESMRDAMLQVAGRLDTQLAGRPVDLEAQPFTNRRSVYGLIDRNNFSSLLRTFDFPSPDTSSPQRPQTTVPQQALFTMNSSFVQEMAKALAERTQQVSSDPGEQVHFLVNSMYSRPIQSNEERLLLTFLQEHELHEMAQALLMSNEFLYVD